MLRELAASLRTAAQASNERRLLVLSGQPDATRAAVGGALEGASIQPEATTLVGPTASLDCEHLPTDQSSALLGRTRDAVVLDLQAACRPNAIGRAVGAVDGGGLLVFLVPPLESWPARRDEFDAGLAVPPFDAADVTGNFRSRLVRTLRQHRGVAIVDVGDGAHDGIEVVDAGRTDDPPIPRAPPPSVPSDPAFPVGTYDACRTDDQVSAVSAFEGIESRNGAVVLEADRGRGKSSAAGLAAAALALDGADVLVTAPAYASAREIFERAVELLTDLGELAGRDEATNPRRVSTETGRIRFRLPVDATALPDDPDVIVVDEAAALPVSLLATFLEAPAVAYATTIHGYEGAGRGFSVRFRDRLEASDRPVTDVTLQEPIRYAGGDPIEVWAFRALALGASPAVEPVVEAATTETVTYESVDPGALSVDDILLRETFGLLVAAHYRTEPDDLARLLDAPNVTIRALCHDGHVVSVALLAREGGLPEDLRASMYEGSRVRGNMLPDVLTSQLRDESAGVPVGQRIMRIATHPAVRSRGLGSALLDGVRAEYGDDVDWLGVGYGATPSLVAFWCENGFRTVHLSTTRNETSGEHSAIMLDPCSEPGAALLDRHAAWFRRRLPAMLADPLSDVDPDVLRETIRSVDGRFDPDLSPTEWRHAAGIAHGAAIFDSAPRPTRRLTLRYLSDPDGPDVLSARSERLLVRKALQAHSWTTVAEELGYHSSRTCKRAFGAAVDSLVETYGTDDALDERRRLS